MMIIVVMNSIVGHALMIIVECVINMEHVSDVETQIIPSVCRVIE